jgi:hypothetical protein
MRPLFPLVIATFLILFRPGAAQEPGDRIHRATIRGAAIGAGLGAITGAVLGGVSAGKLQSCRTSSLIEVCSMEWYERAARGGLIGAAVGGAVGAALGYTVKTRRWEASVTPLGRGLELSVAF